MQAKPIRSPCQWNTRKCCIVKRGNVGRHFNGKRMGYRAPPCEAMAQEKRGEVMKSGNDERWSSSVLSVASLEPTTFLGGVVAGFLGLDIEQDPLRSWIESRAAEAGLAYSLAKERLEKRLRQ